MAGVSTSGRRRGRRLAQRVARRRAHGFDSAVWSGNTILVTLTGYPDEPPMAIEPNPDGRYTDIGAVTGWHWVIAEPATSDATSVTDMGTPTFDALVAERRAAASDTAPSAHGAVPDPQPTGELDGAVAGNAVEATAIVALFSRINAIEEGDGGWPGADTVQELSEWFTALGIDIEADVAAAARTLRLPPLPQAGAATVIVHSPPADVDTVVDRWVGALLNMLGPDSSAVVYDTTGRQLTQHTHSAADPAQS